MMKTLTFNNGDTYLYFEEMKYSIVGEVGTKKQEVLELVQDFAKARKMECNSKTKKLFK